jgi:hypothetical protein
LLLIAATAATLLLHAAAASALNSRHCHSTGQAADKAADIVTADQALATLPNRKPLRCVGEPHAGKPALTGRAAATEAALQTTDAGAG